MKKVKVYIPDWADDKHLYIFAGMEMVAVKPVGGDWLVVEEKCKQCGQCCQDVNENWVFGSVNGVCVHFQEEKQGGTCGLRGYRPFACSCDPYKGGPDYCQVKLKKAQQ